MDVKRVNGIYSKSSRLSNLCAITAIHRSRLEMGSTGFYHYRRGFLDFLLRDTVPRLLRDQLCH
jgi:hypothetical protein